MKPEFFVLLRERGGKTAAFEDITQAVIGRLRQVETDA